MPRHRQVTMCRKSGGPISKFCTCEHCTLSVCAVCGGGEGALTTDCPGTQISGDRLEEICETPLDFTDARGWHQSEPTKRRSPRFETREAAPKAPPTVVHGLTKSAPSTDWEAVDRTMDLKHELAQKAIAWVLADRVGEDHSVTLARLEDEVGARLPKGQEPAEHDRELLGKLEHARIDFRLADQRAQKCDDEFRQVARKLVAALEKGRLSSR